MPLTGDDIALFDSLVRRAERKSLLYMKHQLDETMKKENAK